MRKRVTIKEIAARAGVNPSTVSRVINNSEKYKISDAVRKNVREIMDELEYEPQTYAQSIKTGRSNNLAIILYRLEQDFSSITGSLVWASFCREAMSLGYTTSIMPLENEDFDQEITKKIRAGVADGYLLGGSLIGPLTQNEITKNNRPAICHISDRLDILNELNGINAIYVDNAPVFQEIIQLLRKSNIRKCAVFGPNLKNTDRIHQFRNAGKKHGMEVSLISYSATPSFALDWRTAFQATKGLINELKQHKAVFCSSDLIALGLCDALRENGIIPGKEIFVIGCDNIEDGNLNGKIKPFLTTIDKNESKIGKAMARELDHQINGRTTQKGTFRIPSKLIIRESFNPNQEERQL